MSPHLLFPTNHLPLSSPFVSIYAWDFDSEFNKRQILLRNSHQLYAKISESKN